MGRKLIILFLIVFLSFLAFAISIDFDKMEKFIRVSNEPILMPEGIGFECKAAFNSPFSSIRRSLKRTANSIFFTGRRTGKVKINGTGRLR